MAATATITTQTTPASTPSASQVPKSVATMLQMSIRVMNTISSMIAHTGEWVRTVYWADGHYIREAVRDINWVLRDHHSDEVRPMNAGILDVLGMLRTRLDSHDPFLVISGYRSPTTNHRMHMNGSGVASNSYHIKGMAIDLRSERRDLSQVRGAAMSLRCGGVGYYPRSDFVHVDCGPVRYW